MRKRSKYRPRGVIPDTMAWVQSGFKKVGALPVAGVGLKLKNHEALDAIMRGEGTRDHVDVLIAALNVAEAMYRLKPELGADYAGEIKLAQDAIHAMGRRGYEINRFIFTGPEMQAVRLAMEVHDVQLDECDVRTMEKALDLVNTVVMNKQARPIVSAT